MARVTTLEVEQILDNLDEIELEPFIRVANLMVTDLLSGAGFSSDYLKEIERWLSAHFASIRSPMAEMEKIGPATTKYQTKTGMGLKLTSYGQQVLALDTSGAFAALSKPQAKFAVISHGELPTTS